MRPQVVKYDFEHEPKYQRDDFEERLVNPQDVLIRDPYGGEHKLIHTLADQRAVDEEGCRFDIGRVRHLHHVFTNNLVLWEGGWAGDPARFLPWHYETLVPIFGWVRWSPQWNMWVRRFTRAQVWIPKKNAKSPTGANVGIYLWRYDGEPGQHVYSTAKDGKQAGVMHSHAITVVQRSPSLSAELQQGVVKWNKQTGKLLYTPQDSTYEIMSGDNEEGQEGKNGCVIMDEVHVVPQKLASVIEDMDASRADALHFKISTHGKGLGTYGRREYERGARIRDGESSLTHIFFKSYEAPQDATDDELKDEAVWRACNPSWGITVDALRFRQAFDSARQGSNFEWAAFKMRRLDIWQTSSNPWLRENQWNACEADYRLNKFKGRRCGVAGDFSKVRDLTAVVITTDDDTDSDVIWQWPMFWVPENRVQELEDKVDFREWEQRGHVIITMGDTQNEDRIKADLEYVLAQVDARAMFYDKVFADAITGYLVDEAKVVRERVIFSQTKASYAAPTKQYEKRVRDCTIRHPGNLCYSWQAKHAQVEDPDQPKPVKPDGQDGFRTVDGVQAAVMSLAAFEYQQKAPGSVIGKVPITVIGQDGSAERF